MTLKAFKKILTQLLEKNEWLVDDNKSEFYQTIADNEIVINGDNEHEVFAIRIIKIDPL